VCSQDARTPPSVFDITPDNDLQPNGGPCVLWISGDVGNDWVRWILRGDFAFDGAPDMLGRAAAFVAKVAKTVVGEHRSLLGGNYNLGYVRVRFARRVSPLVNCIDFNFNGAKSIVVDVLKLDDYLHSVPSLDSMQEAVPRPWPLVTAIRMTSIHPPARIVYQSTRSATTSLDIVNRFAPPVTHAHVRVERIRGPTHTYTHTHTHIMMDAYVETDVWFPDQGSSHPGSRSPRPKPATQ